MSVNIKLGEKTISGVDSIRVEDADTVGTYDVFSVSIGYTVSFSSNNTIIQQVSVPSGGTVNEPDDPSAEGYSLVGWYTQSGGQGTAITFPYTPTADITLYAYFVAETFITFSSDESFSLGVANKTKNWNGTLEYSTDKVNWTTWDGTTDIESNTKRGSKYIIALRGSNNKVVSPVTGGRGRFVFSKVIVDCVGNIENLLDYTTVQSNSHPIMNAQCFNYLFYQSNTLRSAPRLPAVTLTNMCYYQMFGGCTILQNAPILPATTMASECYERMFQDCVSLQNAPSLPSTTLSDACYSYMFYNCSSLKTPPVLPATTCTSWCYAYMFAGCTSLETVPVLPSTILESRCYFHMFDGCSSITKISELPALTLKSECYNGMFYNCKGIKLSTTQTGDYQNEYRIPSSGTGTMASSALDNMFQSTGGTFTGTPTINTTYYTSNTIIPATSAT